MMPVSCAAVRSREAGRGHGGRRGSGFGRTSIGRTSCMRGFMAAGARPPWRRRAWAVDLAWHAGCPTRRRVLAAARHHGPCPIGTLIAPHHGADSPPRPPGQVTARARGRPWPIPTLISSPSIEHPAWKGPDDHPSPDDPPPTARARSRSRPAPPDRSPVAPCRAVRDDRGNRRRRSGGGPAEPAVGDPAGHGDVRAGRRHLADERVDRRGGAGPGHHGQRRAVGDRVGGAGVGRVHPDRQQGRRPDRPQTGLRAWACSGTRSARRR